MSPQFDQKQIKIMKSKKLFTVICVLSISGLMPLIGLLLLLTFLFGSNAGTTTFLYGNLSHAPG